MSSNQVTRQSLSVAGIRVPDSKLVLEAEEMVRQASSLSLFNHAFRTYLFGELLGHKQGLRYDSEILFLSAIMHDLGLTQKFSGGERFEVDGADAATTFLAQRGFNPAKVAIVWDAIALHTSLGIADRKQPEVALVHLGATIDVAGFHLDQIGPGEVKEVLEAYPRLAFKEVLLQSIAQVVRQKPRTAAFNITVDIGRRFIPGFQTLNFCDLVLTSPFSE